MESLALKINGRTVALQVDGERTLLWVLRTDLGLTGTKYGCGQALCGACTVLIDGKAARSCLMPVKSVGEREMLTIEGLASNGGEPAIPSVGAVLGNAIFDATGARLTRMPMTPARIKEAIAAAALAK